MFIYLSTIHRPPFTIHHPPIMTIETPANQPTNTPIQEPILCPHCKRTATNGIKCKGICVAESDY
jgi:hypothetical protein